MLNMCGTTDFAVFCISTETLLFFEQKDANILEKFEVQKRSKRVIPLTASLYLARQNEA